MLFPYTVSVCECIALFEDKWRLLSGVPPDVWLFIFCLEFLLTGAAVAVCYCECDSCEWEDAWRFSQRDEFPRALSWIRVNEVSLLLVRHCCHCLAHNPGAVDSKFSVWQLFIYSFVSVEDIDLLLFSHGPLDLCHWGDIPPKALTLPLRLFPLSCWKTNNWNISRMELQQVFEHVLQNHNGMGTFMLPGPLCVSSRCLELHASFEEYRARDLYLVFTARDTFVDKSSLISGTCFTYYLLSIGNPSLYW